MGFLQFKSLDQRRLKLKPKSANTRFSLTFLSFDEEVDKLPRSSRIFYAFSPYTTPAILYRGRAPYF